MMSPSKETCRSPRLAKPIRTLIAILFWVVVWQLAATLFGKPLIFPAPRQVFPRFISLLGTGYFWRSALHSLRNILLGFLIGCLVGILAGIAIRLSRVADTLLTPLFSAIRATPVACFIIVAWVMIGSARLPVLIAALMVSPVMMEGTASGISQAPPPLLEAARAYRLSFFRTVQVVYLPSVIPHFSSSVITSSGLAWKSGIAAEVIALTADTLGYAVYMAKSWNMDTVDLFAWTFAIILINLLLEGVLRAVLRRFTKREVPTC